jgi:uncharacterized membrane protein YGL010W
MFMQMSGLSHLLMCAGLIAAGVGLMAMGHKVFEKKSPVSFDDPLSAVFALYFPILEFLATLGYKKDLFAKCRQIVKDKSE